MPPCFCCGLLIINFSVKLFVENEVLIVSNKPYKRGKTQYGTYTFVSIFNQLMFITKRYI